MQIIQINIVNTFLFYDHAFFVQHQQMTTADPQLHKNHQ